MPACVRVCERRRSEASTVLRRGCVAAAGARGRSTGLMRGEGKRKGAGRGLTPRRAQSSPRHACGLFPPFFPHPCGTAQRTPQQGGLALRQGGGSLRIPAPNACFQARPGWPAYGLGDGVGPETSNFRNGLSKMVLSDCFLIGIRLQATAIICNVCGADLQCH